MILAALPQDIAAFQATVSASKPLAALSALQRAALAERGSGLVARIDAAMQATGAVLDAPDPSGHPLAMIADLRARRAASTDLAALSDLRGYFGRAAFNLSQGVA